MSNEHGTKGVWEDSSDSRTDNTSSTQDYTYRSTYEGSRKFARLIAGIGWVMFVIGVLFFISAVFGGESIAAMIAILVIPLSAILVVFGQITRATADCADYTGEMLAIMKADRERNLGAYHFSAQKESQEHGGSGGVRSSDRGWS